MPVTIESESPQGFPSADSAPDTGAVKPGQKVPTSIKIEGVLREAFSVTIGGKTVIYTGSLTVLERRALSRAMKTEDVTAPEAYGFNLAAARVRMINENPIAFPSNEAQIVYILKELGDEAATFLYDDYNATFRKATEEKAKN